MFPIVTIESVRVFAELQNNFGSIAIQRNMLNHRTVTYRSFLIPISSDLNQKEIVLEYLRNLNFFSRTVVTSVRRYKAGYITLAVPTFGISFQPFYSHLDGDMVKIEMEPNFRDSFDEAAKGILDSKRLVGAVVAEHYMNDERAIPFRGKIEGSLFSTIRARLNRTSWPREAKESR